jgi:predicted nucleic acid-binding protein
MGRGADERSLFVDSGAWIAYFSLRDGRHREADARLRAAVAARRRLVTTNLVLAEVHRWLLFRAGIGPAAATLDRIDATRIDATPLVQVVYPTAEHHRAARAWLARLADQRITYTDAVSFAVMSALGCRAALTFDSDFTVAGFTPWQPEVGGA